MKKLTTLTIICAVLLIAALSGAADQAATTATGTTTATAWIMANSTAIFAVLLAISEFLALIPGLKGNGILDSIVKTLKTLAGTNKTP